MAVAKFAEVKDVFAQDIQDGLHARISIFIPRTHDIQLALIGMGRGAPQRRIEVNCAFLGQSRNQNLDRRYVQSVLFLK